MPSASHNFSEDYKTKTAQYFDGARSDMVAKLHDNSNARILEIGCGFGGTGELALASGKCGEYYGLEIDEAAAAVARQKLTGVVVGNVETVEFPWAEKSFDALIISEVLEHLVDPWKVLERLNPLLCVGCVVLASSPNVSQYKIILALLRGHWNLTDVGVMDRTHLRWFTPATYQEMFEKTGYAVDVVEPIVPFANRVKFINLLTFGRFRHLFMRQINLTGHKV